MIELITKLLIPILCFVLTIYIIPFLKEKKIYNYVKIAVEAAEQMFNESGKGEEKFAYVKEWVKSKFNINDEDLKNIIESVVYNINLAKGENNGINSRRNNGN